MMFSPNITPESLAWEIASRLIGARTMAFSNIVNALRDFPAIQRLMSILLNPVPGQMITGQELSVAMNELLNLYNKKVEHILLINFNAWLIEWVDIKHISTHRARSHKEIE